jgi:hypothetical protein
MVLGLDMRFLGRKREKINQGKDNPNKIISFWQRLRLARNPDGQEGVLAGLVIILLSPTSGRERLPESLFLHPVGVPFREYVLSWYRFSPISQ